MSWIASQLARPGLASSLHSIQCKDSVDRGEPEPELYLAVPAALAIESGEAVSFRDSQTGAKAARPAGVGCVAVPNPATADLTWGPVDLMVPLLAAVTLDLLGTLGRRAEGDQRTLWISHSRDAGAAVPGSPALAPPFLSKCLMARGAT